MGSDSPKSLLNVQNLSKHYNLGNGLWEPISLLRAVDDVSFTLDTGRTLGIVGESGSGKSTLAKMIMCLVPPTSGSILFDGLELNKLSGWELQKKRADIQMVFQDPYSSLNPRMTVASLLSEPFYIHRKLSWTDLRTQLLWLLNAVGLPSGALTRYPHEFSGGQRQRIGLARAIALRPKLVVLDEPVSALDVSIQSQILNLLKDLAQELNLTYIFISHDLAVVEYMSDHMIVMHQGKVVEKGETKEVCGRPQHPYTKTLLESTFFL